MASAMETFLSTPELLEALFLECDMRSLLVAVQRVCKQWHEIISESPSVQVHLFLRPANPAITSRPIHNPLLVVTFPPFFGRIVDAGLEEFVGHFFGRREIEQMPLARRREPFMRREATWRRMQVQQPSLRTLGVSITFEKYSFALEKEINMGMLYDYILRILTSVDQQWRLWWRDILEFDHSMPGHPEFDAECTREAVREVGVVLVRRSTPWPTITIRPSDRDFLTTFSHPSRLSSQSLDLAPRRRIMGKISRREQREL